MRLLKSRLCAGVPRSATAHDLEVGLEEESADSEKKRKADNAKGEEEVSLANSLLNSRFSNDNAAFNKHKT